MSERALIAAWLMSAMTSATALEPAVLPDPTRPPAAHRSAVIRATIDRPQEFVVSAIKISGDSRRALVNNQLVAEGDRIGEAEIVAITPGTVEIDYLSQRLQVTLLPTAIRRSADQR